MTSPARPGEAPTAAIADLPLAPSFGRGWRIALAASAMLVLVFLWGLAEPALIGVGVWGINIPFVWGFDIVNYVWWIGIANGASFFAAVLVIRRHGLRTSVNRFAEGLALFAVICAAIFPIVHLGRPWLFYWVFPYPATFEVWPQFRSPLTWDFWAINTHLAVTALFWYLGLIPDLATLRDRARRRGARIVFGLFALGWRGAARHWLYHQTAHRLVAALILPLIVVIQSTVAFEFAVSIVPDWHKARQPLHFVVTGFASGLAMVLLVAVLLRRGLGLGRYITHDNLDLIGRLLLAGAVIVALVYLEEIVVTTISEPLTREALFARLFTFQGTFYWSAVLLLVIVPQALWWRRVRESTPLAVAIALAVMVGVWLDRYSIVVGGMQRDYLPAMWRLVGVPGAEWPLLFGSLGFFAFLVLLFVRYLPVISMFETRHAETGEP